MTIDETIEMYKKIANTDSNCPRYCMNPCEDCVKECKQVAEWLEELKSYRASVFSGDMTQTMLKEQYCKAIDDFVNKINESNQGHWRPTRYEHGEVVSETMSYDIGTIRLIAKQLKAGKENE